MTGELDALRPLSEAATPGPWTREYGGQNWWIASCGIGEQDMTVWSPASPTPDHGGEREDDGGEADRRNAEFIVAAVNYVRTALAAPSTEPTGEGRHERDETIERLTAALRVAAHSPHDQAGGTDHGFPVCSVCGAIQTGESRQSEGLREMAKYVISHGVHSPFCAWTVHGWPCDCGLQEAVTAASAALDDAPKEEPHG